MKSNLSVGPPLDLVVYEANRFQTDKIVCIDPQNPYYRMLHSGWGQKLREVFDSLEDPVWDDTHTEVPLKIERRPVPAAQEDLESGRAVDLTPCCHCGLGKPLDAGSSPA